MPPTQPTAPASVVRTPTVVIVSGPAASGKTTLARQLADRLTLPLYVRDRIKEALFDTLGWSDRRRSKELGAASVAVLFAQLADTLRAGASCITESNFRRTHSSGDFRRLLADTGARAIQVQCVTNGEVLVRRFAARAGTADRHPGHGDENNLEEFRHELEHGRYEPLDLTGPVLTIDTTDLNNVPIADLGDMLANLLNTEPPLLT